MKKEQTYNKTTQKLVDRPCSETRWAQLFHLLIPQKHPYLGVIFCKEDEISRCFSSSEASGDHRARTGCKISKGIAKPSPRREASSSRSPLSPPPWPPPLNRPGACPSLW
eukprot:g20012.t1